MYRGIKKYCFLLAFACVLAACAPELGAKELNTPTTAGAIDIVIPQADGTQLVLQSEREAAPAASHKETASAVSQKETAPAESEALTTTAPDETVEETTAAPATTAEETTTAPEETTSALASEVGFVPTGTVTCISEGARIRETPRGTVLGSCNYGEVLEVDGELVDGGWIHVRSEHFGVGYVYMDLVR